MLSASEKLVVLGRYIGQKIVIRNLREAWPDQIGRLTGINERAIQVDINSISRWIPLTDEISLNEIKLLLKPLKKLTSSIIETANNLPVQSFIVPYYQQLGFDMPVFIAPGHPCNCKYMSEIGLAEYSYAEESKTVEMQLVVR